MRIALAAGALAGALAAVAFFVVHAMVIVPIWWSAGGAWKAVVCGALIGGAAYVVLGRLPRLRDVPWVAGFLWIALLAPSACIHFARMGHVPELFEDALGVAANVVFGAALALGAGLMAHLLPRWKPQEA